MPPKKTAKIGRDAGTGKLKPVKQAEKDKEGPVVETIKRKKGNRNDRATVVLEQK